MRLEPRGMTALTASLIAVMLLVPGCNQPVPLSSGGPVDSSVSAAASAPAAETSAAGTQPKQAGAGAEAAGAGEAGKAAQPVAADAGQAGGEQTAAGSPSAGAAGSAMAAPGAAGTVPAGTAPAGDAATGPGGPQAAAEQAASKQAKPAATKNIVKEAGKTPILTFDDLYAEMTVRGVKLSDKVNQLAGKKVEMTGFMAPPLTAKVNFFVLTKVALTVCPFCSTDADWPTDIVVVFMPKGKDVTPTEHQVKVTGTLSVGSQTDEETGFVSLIRINADIVEVLK
ncbi:hypothetical protein NLX71_06735 [Paenibacillus sp. MZ04-78.2]|uniref:hypothetical protein n=1 Tax=Paenibacillus sp. MZ04-78.2 TaxID=2962034 RepID=UPI0020B8BA03|nr:hypothetical protein [Paenibacillus sp. MZ04-78.2]MCP3773017.1 hypothetical protein [Paenibacillus sp. MZ04-78.2]